MSNQTIELDFMAMPNDCKLCIFELLNVDGIHIMSSVCKLFNELAKNELLWKLLFNNEFDIEITESYRQKYKEYSRLDYFLMDLMDEDINEIRKMNDLYFAFNELQ